MDVILEANPDIEAWFNKIISRGRKYNMFIETEGNKELKISKDGYSETIKLDEGLEQLKLDLLSLKEKYPIP